MKIGKKIAQKLEIGGNPILGLSFPVFNPGPMLGPICFPILGRRRPETYFLAGRLDHNLSRPSAHLRTQSVP